MKKCYKCNVDINSINSKCPLCQSVLEKAMVVGYTRMLRRALRRPNEAESPAKIARCKEMLSLLLNKVDTLSF